MRGATALAMTETKSQRQFIDDDLEGQKPNCKRRIAVAIAASYEFQLHG
jgi:hypothetical protein